ncbi:MAG: gliding-motility protein MglA [Acidobacteriota bacterium]|nr:gliding-motility protein MglA [Acidobacteriota bacterium]
MSFINKALREINCKIVYYGAGLGGKTTNLQWVFEQTSANSGEKMLSLATEDERTLFFDFLPLDLGQIRGYKVRLHLYTVPGQMAYQSSRKLILRGVDGVVLVADSQPGRMEANIAAIDDLQQNLKELGQDFSELPYVLQLNKRDLADSLSSAEMMALLARKGEPVFEAVASRGAGVLDTLKGIGRLVLGRVRRG